MILPQPSADALEHSRRLAQRIRDRIGDAGGVLPFSRFMEMALYEPGLGYYSAGLRKFGAGGDFVTAPEISPLFGRAIATAVAAVLDALQGGDVLEFGAGSGRLAADLLAGLQARDALPGRYCILERSADLRERQQQLLREECPEFYPRLQWLDTLPEDGFAGVMLGNEVLDAMAVERFRWRAGHAEQFFVAGDGDEFTWRTGPFASAADAAKVQRYAQEYGFPDGYESELHASLPPWLHAVSGSLERGLLLLVDYGYPRSEYYHPQRNRGTLQCHYRHIAHDDPLRWPGLQDITSHVDFTAVAESAVADGLAVAGYASQAHFLLDCGIENLLMEDADIGSVDYLRQAQQVKTLLLPGEMGERFQCIGLARGLDIDIPGFRMQDLRYRL